MNSNVLSYRRSMSVSPFSLVPQYARELTDKVLKCMSSEFQDRADEQQSRARSNQVKKPNAFWMSENESQPGSVLPSIMSERLIDRLTNI